VLSYPINTQIKDSNSYNTGFLVGRVDVSALAALIMCFLLNKIILKGGGNNMIWSGLGILVPIITYASLVLTEYSVGILFNNQNYFQDSGWPKFFALLIAAVLCFFIGRVLNKDNRRIYIDEKTGKEIAVIRRHSFCFINIEYWAIIFPIIGMALCLVK
jgi:hypothetical protein